MTNSTRGKADRSLGLDRAHFAGRAAALEGLVAILRRRVPLDEAIDFGGLEERDRAFARLLVAGTLRRLGQIDLLIANRLQRPLPRAALPVFDLLRMAVFQLVFLGTPAHAAVDTAVEMTTAMGQGGFAKLVNAVLRRIADDGANEAALMDAPLVNTPDWLWQSWSASYGEDICRAIASAHLVEAPLDLTVKTDAALWAERLQGEVLQTGSLRLAHGGAVSDLAGFADGAWWVQDAAAALPAKLIPEPMGKRVADLCAAPGGKTAQLALAGAEITALDRSGARLARLRENLDRLGLDAHLIEADAMRWTPDAPPDAILLDAPCSATGTLRRHPDIARTKTPGDVAAIARTQAKLLDHALAILKPGGVLVYCTCSLEAAEGEAQIDRVLATMSGARRWPVEAGEIGGMDDLITSRGDLRSLPCHLAQKGGMDGFYAARLIKD